MKNRKKLVIKDERTEKFQEKFSWECAYFWHWKFLPKFIFSI